MADLTEGRVFWPLEIWKQYLPDKERTEIEALLVSQQDHDTMYHRCKDALRILALPENRKRAMACLNHLCADALELVPDCLEYMSYLKEPSVFRFAAIPQVLLKKLDSNIRSWPLPVWLSSLTTLVCSTRRSQSKYEGVNQSG